MENALVLPDITLTIEDIKKHIAPKATDKELFYFMNIAKSYNLNPMKREIYFVKYGENPGQSIVGYETYLKRAERTGQLDGWKCWTEKDEKGEKAIIEIYRKDRSIPLVWEVHSSEFDKKQSTWKAMPNFMLKKVAIAQGFRLAFPDELGGLPYTHEESEIINAQIIPEKPEIKPPQMKKPEAKTETPAQSENKEFISEAQRKKFYAVYKNSSKTDDEVKKYLLSEYSIEHSTDILKSDFNTILEWAEKKSQIDWLALTEQAGTIQDRAEWERFKAENKIDKNIGSAPEEFKTNYDKCQKWQK